MEYTTLGNTDIQISKLCVGCMSFGKAGTMHDWTLDETEKVVKHALEPLSSSPRCGRHCPESRGWQPEMQRRPNQRLFCFRYSVGVNW